MNSALTEFLLLPAKVLVIKRNTRWPNQLRRVLDDYADLLANTRGAPISPTVACSGGTGIGARREVSQASSDTDSYVPQVEDSKSAELDSKHVGDPAPVSESFSDSASTPDSASDSALSPSDGGCIPRMVALLRCGHASRAAGVPMQQPVAETNSATAELLRSLFPRAGSQPRRPQDSLPIVQVESGELLKIAKRIAKGAAGGPSG